jgi:RNA polymerase sigma factor (sigma-70 family)
MTWSGGPRRKSRREGTEKDDAVALMDRYCEGDVTAFRALYALAAPRILAYLTCLIRDRPAAEELLQQTFMKLHRSRGSYVRGADPIPWLYTIAHRTCLDELRRARRARENASQSAHCFPEAFAALDGASERARPSYDQATVEAVLEALEKLPEQQRVAIVLTKIQGKSVAEAAAILGTTSMALKLRVHRGYTMLRALVPQPIEDA